MTGRPYAAAFAASCRGLAAGSLIGWISVGSGAAGEQQKGSPFTVQQLQFYEQQVLPILADNCYKCHSHQADKIKANFVLDSREGALKGGETGPAIIPGDPDHSLLMKAVRHESEDLQMPPRKKLSGAQIAALASWIKMGAPYAEAKPGAAAKIGGKKIGEEDRKWWAYQPVRKIVPPAVEDQGWGHNPVDKFIFDKLQSSGLGPAPEADRRTLVRRAYYDVLGLPPTAEEVEQFVSDPSAGAYEALIDKLLADSRYGEKWARHWLDLVRYAESDGYKSDSFRPTAWRYRDYVIRSFNEDKPYDRFIMEQLAADELWPDEPNSLAGVGFLRLWIYEYNQRNVKGQWATILDDITDVTGDVFLGMGLQCARCHDHKFDPILQQDYYRMQAFFAALCPRDDAPLATPEQARKYDRELAAWEEKTATIRAEIEKLEAPVRASAEKAVVIKFPREIQSIMAKPASERSPYEQQIRDLAYRQVTEEEEKLDSKFHGADKQRLDALKKELSAFDSLKPKPLPGAMLVQDIGSVAPPTTIPKDKTQTPIEPGFPTVLEEGTAKIAPPPCGPSSTGRRAALARWLAQPGNPLTARVFVNRVWQHHFGRGLSSTPSDLGHLGQPPSHPELLDWLTTYFVEHHWSGKELHRLILTSATYRQSSILPPAQALLAARVDPENRLLWKQTLRRLDAEQLRDTLLAVSGELDPKAGGPSVETSKPRRTIYTQWLRNSRDPLLAAFDPPDPYISTPERNATTTPLQSLAMLNGPYVLQRGRALAERLQQMNLAPAAAVRQAYRLAYGRDPTETEKRRGLGFLAEQANRIGADNLKLAPVTVQPMPGRAGTAAMFQPDSPQTRLVVPDNPLMPQNDFTVEAYVQLRAHNSKRSFHSIISRWDGRKNQPGWSLGVAGKNSDYPAQILVLELIGDPAEEGTGGYETISSGFTVDPGKSYYVAVSVRLGDTSETGVTFYLKELSLEARLRVAQVPHHVTATHASNLSLVIGARDAEKHVIWDGLIDDVRLSRRALERDQLLLKRDDVDESTVGFWRFELPDALKDSSVNGHNIRPEVSPAAEMSAAAAALIDFCDVLLNSDELLYVD